jgi:RNA polymerase sigma factor (sigma-70 family)
MEAYEVVIVGPAGAERAGLELLLRDLGHVATGASYDEAPRAAAGRPDVILVLDRRGPEAASRTLAALDLPRAAPVLLMSGRIRRQIASLAPRRIPSDDRPRLRPETWLAPLSTLADEDLARLAAAGSVPAYEELHGRYDRALGRYCSSILRRSQDAEEAVQSTMLSAYQALRSGRVEDALKVRPWLFRIAHNQCVDMLRRRRGATEELPEAEPSREEEPLQLVARRVALRTLVRDLAALEEGQRIALVLRELGGLSHAEIATTLATTPARAKALILQAREALAAFGAGRDLPCDEVRRRLVEGDGRVLRSREMRAHLNDCPRCAAEAGSGGTRRASEGMPRAGLKAA